MDSLSTPGVAPASPFDIDKLVSQYIALRNRKEAIEQTPKTELATLKEIMDKLEAKLLSYMQDAKLDHVASPSGTAYRSTRLSATIKDGKAFREYVIGNSAYQ